MFADEHQHRVERVEILAQAGFELLDGALPGLSAQQSPGEAMQLLGDGIVGPCHGDEIGQFLFQARVPLAQYLDLAFHQRDSGAAPGMRQSQPCQQRLVVLKEFRILLQIVRNSLLFTLLRLDSPRLSGAHVAVSLSSK